MSNRKVTELSHVLRYASESTGTLVHADVAWKGSETACVLLTCKNLHRRDKSKDCFSKYKGVGDFSL